MTQRIFLLAVLVFFGSLMPGLPASAQETLKKPSEMPKPLLAPVVGHRGFSYDFPEFSEERLTFARRTLMRKCSWPPAALSRKWPARKFLKT